MSLSRKELVAALEQQPELFDADLRQRFSVLAELDASRTKLTHLKDELHSTRQHIRQTLSALPEEIGTDLDLRDALIKIIYWGFGEEVHAAWLAEVFDLTVHRVAQIARKIDETVSCSRCGQPVPITNMSDLVRVRSGTARALCEHCHKQDMARQQIAQEAQRRRWEEAQHAASERLTQLREMPLDDYYQTPEWQERRKEMLKRARYRCQVCNGGKNLHVCHRTFIHRGNEPLQDLVVLCASCHQLYYEQGKLPRTEGER